MGTWGTGLYSGDFALDLRSAVGAVVRLPYEPDRLVDILCEHEARAARDPGDEDHPTFWLVLADQFAKRGIACERVRQRGLEIIDAGDDVAMLEQLGVKPSHIRKRRAMLDALRARIVAAPASTRPRPVLKEPQPLLMDVGDVLIYPIANCYPINPYMPTKGKVGEQYWATWTADGWAAMVILGRGRAFDFLSWYRPLTLAEGRREKPQLDALRGDVLWRIDPPGTCSPEHFEKMRLERIGTVAIDQDKVKRAFSTWLISGTPAAISDISIANAMNTLLDGEPPLGRPTIRGLEQVLAG